jgi:thiamine-monophosphate kinase
MNLARKGELALVNDIRARFSSRLPRGGTGIGDDAAIMTPGSGKLLATVDAMVEGVHFDLSLITPRQLGFKLVAVNASDIYAMAGKPQYLLLSMALPPQTRTSFVDRFFDGIEEGLKVHGTVLAGGDLSSSLSDISLSATVLGYATKPAKRSGARVGHGIFVNGTLGDSSCGFELLKKIGRTVDIERGRQRPLGWKIMAPLLKRHLTPEPRPLGGVALSTVSSMMDLSDGLLLDLWRLCSESGAGAVLYEKSIPVSEEMRAAAMYLGIDPLDLALSGGEDYLILFTSGRKQIRGAVRIGEIIPSGYKLIKRSGKEMRLAPHGYGHFGRNNIWE